MTITYDQAIWTSQRVTAKGSNEHEFDLVEKHMEALGYERKQKPKDVTQPWEAFYIRAVVLADSAVGDKIALDGRYELAEGGET